MNESTASAADQVLGKTSKPNEVSKGTLSASANDETTELVSTNDNGSGYGAAVKGRTLNSSSTTKSCSLRAICQYLREHFTTITIVSLLLLIFALTCEIVLSNREAADLVEEKKSSLNIQWRPCQMYLGDSTDVSNVKVIQTSMGDPSTHWGQISCLVRNEHRINMESSDETQWNWFSSSSSTVENPIEYGMPSANVKVDFDAVAHPERKPIVGFGGAFTEASALNYMSLNEEGREAVIELLFGKGGLGYSLGRVHMNSCDFSVESYNFDDFDGDFNLTNFDVKVEHDVTSGMIEFMLQANNKFKKEWSLEEGIKIMASPWSPPAWMKKPTWKEPPGLLHAESMTGSALNECLREGTGPDSRYAATWALYFSKFLAAYKAWGVDLFAVTVQNEPLFPWAPWEACAYEPDNEADFIVNHLGPVLKRDHPDVKLLIFDQCKDRAVEWASYILNRTNPASDFVDGIALHWYGQGGDVLLDGAQGAPNMHRLMSVIVSEDVKKEHLVLGSEACNCPSTGYAGGDLSVAWFRAERYAHTILSDLAAGSNGWVEWNLVLDSVGGPNRFGNTCDAPILAVPYRVGGKHNITDLPSFEHTDFPFGPVVGDTRTREELNAMGFPAKYLDKGLVVQPMFYYMGHISRHVRPGSRAVYATIANQAGLGTKAFLQTIGNTTIAGGGINNLARPGIEVTLWPCEGSTRQKWTMSDDGQLQVFGHDWKGRASVSCIGSVVDPSYEGTLLSPCDSSAGRFTMENRANSPTVNILMNNSKNSAGENCVIAKPLKNNGGAYGPRGGAQVAIGSCDSDAAMWNFDSTSGEIKSNFFEKDGGEVCATTGWPFLQVGAFIGPEGKHNKTIVVLNEASEPANYVLRNGDGNVFMTNSIPSRSIQTIIF